MPKTGGNYKQKILVFFRALQIPVLGGRESIFRFGRKWTVLKKAVCNQSGLAA
jgi:hypothetical protein